MKYRVKPQQPLFVHVLIGSESVECHMRLIVPGCSKTGGETRSKFFAARMAGIDPGDRLWGLHCSYIQIDDYCFLPAADHDAFESFVRVCVYFLVRNERRDKDKIARTGLGDILELFAPSHSRAALDDIDHAFELAVVMGAGPGVSVDRDCAGP